MDSALRHGTTALEIKSGYGLTLASELKILRVVRRLAAEGPQDVAATFLGAHALPLESRSGARRKAHVRAIAGQWLPRVAREKLADSCDVFCERGAFTLAESRRILMKAGALGMKVRIHAEQLSRQGGCALGAALGAASVDHADFASEADIRRLARSRTPAVLLPGVSHFLRAERWPPARRMMQAGVAVALATDCNPGSCFTENMQEIMALACLRMGFRVEEALTAGTLNAAAALGWASRMGSLEMGKQADFLLLDVPDYRHLVYHYGVNHVAAVFKRGNLVHEKRT
jgi:imidazolonepropionase